MGAGARPEQSRDHMRPLDGEVPPLTPCHRRLEDRCRDETPARPQKGQGEKESVDMSVQTTGPTYRRQCTELKHAHKEHEQVT